MFTPAQSLEDQKNERAFGRNIWSPLKGRKFIAAERLHLRAQGIAAVFASCRHAVAGSRSCTAVTKAAVCAPKQPSGHFKVHHINKMLPSQSSINLRRTPCPRRYPSGAVPPVAALLCPSQPCYGPDSAWASSCGWELRSRVSPSSHPAEIPKLKRPKGDINSWHPRTGELT